MNKTLRLALGLLLMAVITPLAWGAKPFYDSKSWIVNVAGDAQFLKDNGFGTKVYDLGELGLKVPNLLTQIPDTTVCKEIAAQLTREGYGKKVIDALTDGGKGESMLLKEALWNAQKQDLEFASETANAAAGQDVSQLVAEDYLPILTHNYIVLTYKNPVQIKDSKTGAIRTEYVPYYAIFRVDVTNEEAFDIMSHLGDPIYNDMKFPVSYCYSGKWEEDKTEAKIAKNVPDLAVRGVLLQRNPARISMGENVGMKKGDLVSIYSQQVDANGNPFSKRISRARVCGVWDEEAQVNFVAGTAGNRKNGDIVVRTPDSRQFIGIQASYGTHTWGGQIVYDYEFDYTRSGIVHHLLADLAFNMTDHPGDKFITSKDPYNWRKAPWFANIGVGYGIGKTFLGYLDVMPYVMAQYEMSLMMKSDFGLGDATGDTKDSSMPMGSALRVPVGLRLAANVAYPVRIILDAGYAFNVGFGEDYDIIKQTNKFMGVKRNGLFINLGVAFGF